MFSRRWYPEDRWTWSSSGPFLFDSFPSQVHIKSRGPEDSNRGIKSQRVAGRRVNIFQCKDNQDQSLADGSRRVKFADPDGGYHWELCTPGKSSPNDQELQDSNKHAAVSWDLYATAKSLPSEQELIESGKHATAKLVQWLNHEADDEELRQNRGMNLKISARIPSPQVPAICDQFYFKDITQRPLLDKKGILGRLPQVRPKPFLWVAEESSCAVPRSQVITMGYRIQFPRDRDRKFSSPEDHFLSVSGLRMKKDNTFREPSNVIPKQTGSRPKEKPVDLESNLRFSPCPKESKIRTLEGKAVPELKYSANAAFKIPWWALSKPSPQQDKGKYPSPRSPGRQTGQRFWTTAGPNQPVSGVPLSGNMLKIKFSSKGI